MESQLENNLRLLLNSKLEILEKYLDADVLVYYGPIGNLNENVFLKLVEELAQSANHHNTLYILLTTTGGSAITVERYVNIIRHHYSEVNFIVPDYAYSAGTIFCMSGDSIFMDYFSVLGPIDPQVQNKEGKWVAALGYLDKVNEYICLLYTSLGLTFIGGSLCRFFKDTNVKQFFVRFSTKHIFIDIARASYTFICLQFLDPFCNMVNTIRSCMICFIQPPPFQTTHVSLYHSKRSSNPIYHLSLIHI